MRCIPLNCGGFRFYSSIKRSMIMKFGFFDDANKEYVINSPKTPYPWINYLGTQDFFSLISNTAGGYHFFKDARLRRITRYRYNNIPVDMGGRYFYINDNGSIWSPGWAPVWCTLVLPSASANVNSSPSCQRPTTL